MEVKLKQKDGTLMDLVAEIKDGVLIVEPKEEEYKPKDGDIVYSGVSLISILKSLTENDLESYVSFDGEYLYIEEGGFRGDNLRPATEEEKQKLFKALANNGLSWDAEKMELVGIKWKPKDKERYYYPYNGLEQYTFEVSCNVWVNDRIDKFLYEKGWAFPYTEQGKADCQKLVDKINEAINSVKP